MRTGTILSAPSRVDRGGRPASPCAAVTDPAPVNGIDVDASRIGGIWWRHIPPGADALHKHPRAYDNRWQRGSVIDAFYLSDSADTTYAEWYRTLARQRTAVIPALPFDLVRFEVQIAGVADLSSVGRLKRAGLPAPRAGTGFPEFQAVGERLFASGYAGLVAPTDARLDHLVLCVFRPDVNIAGIAPVLPTTRVIEPPLVPTGMTT